MHTRKLFDPVLVGRTFVSPYVPRLAREEAQRSPRWWESKAEARKYAWFLAEGLTFWSTIDIVAALTLVFASLFVSIPLIAILLFVAFAVGCPLIMTLGIGYGCLRHLTVRETWTIVRDYFLE